MEEFSRNEFILNLSPAHNKTSFVQHQPNEDQQQSLIRIEGQVEFKLKNTTATCQFINLSLDFTATEDSQLNQQSIELHQQSTTLWSAATPTATPLGNIPFLFTLPPQSELAQCVHLPNQSGINYQLTATLTYQPSTTPVVPEAKFQLVVPIHIQPQLILGPSKLNTPKLTPIFLSLPTPLQISIPKTVLQESESLPLQIRIPVPSDQAIHEKGLQLRSVRAQLSRHIRERSLSPLTPDHVTTTALATSGKSCRFSSSRPVFLRLTLHSLSLANSTTLQSTGSRTLNQSTHNLPSSTNMNSQCATITQSTAFYDVYFSLLVVINIIGKDGERQDVEIQRDITIIPHCPSADFPNPTTSGKAKEAAEETHCQDRDSLSAVPLDRNGPAPTYVETDHQLDYLASASTSQPIGLDLQTIGPPLDWEAEEEEEEEEEEYDGYESFSSRIGQDGPAPPTIDEDESPPPAPDTPPEGIELQAPLVSQPEQIPHHLHLNSFTTHPDFQSVAEHILSQSQLRAGDREEFALHARMDQTEGSCGQPLTRADGRAGNSSVDDQRALERRLTDEEVGRPPAYAAGWIDNHPNPPDHHQDFLDQPSGTLQHPDHSLHLDILPTLLPDHSLEPPPYAADL